MVQIFKFQVSLGYGDTQSSILAMQVFVTALSALLIQLERIRPWLWKPALLFSHNGSPFYQRRSQGLPAIH